MTSEQGVDRHILVVWNREAGSKGGLPTNGVGEEDLREAMRRHGLGDELIAPASEEEARARVRAAVADGYDVVVAAGGDGTAGLVGRELLGTATALGILPLGSAMNISRSLALPRDLDEAAAVIANGSVRRIDVGEAADRVFFEIASIGLDAAMFAEAQRVDRGEYHSLLRLLRVVIGFQPARIELVLDGRVVRTRALMLAVANTPYTGLGLTLAPQARLDDGAFDVSVYSGFSRWELVRHLGAIIGGRPRYSPKIRSYRGVRVGSSRPLPVRIDAEDLGTTPAAFSVRPGALQVIAPAQAGPAGTDAG